MYKNYRAYYKAGTYEMSIITVIAQNIEEATQKIAEQLDMNPSRRQALAVWERDGRIVKEVQE